MTSSHPFVDPQKPPQESSNSPPVLSIELITSSCLACLAVLRQADRLLVLLGGPRSSRRVPPDVLVRELACVDRLIKDVEAIAFGLAESLRLSRVPAHWACAAAREDRLGKDRRARSMDA